MLNNIKEMIDIGELECLLNELISIESINPSYPGATSGEDRIGSLVFEYLKKAGLNCKKHEVVSGRHNIVAFLEGHNHKSLCLETHMDTVGVKGMICDPFHPVVRDGMIYGRGSCDAKGSLASMMYAMKLLSECGEKPENDIYMVAVVDEESDYKGISHLLNMGFKVSGAIVGEPTGLNVVTACKGVIRWRVHTCGKAGHSSKIDNTKNAIYDMVDLIQCIREKLIPTYKNKSHKLLGNTTISIGCISGGTAVNEIPESCVIEIDRRILPGEGWNNVAKEFNSLIEELSTIIQPDVIVEEPYMIDEAMDADINQPLAAKALNVCKDIIGTSEIIGAGFGSDVTKFYRAGIPGIILGPGNILQAHSQEEFVSLQEVAKATEIYAQICMNY